MKRRVLSRPRWIERAQYSGSCRQCGAEIAAGDRILYFDADRALMCESCGEAFKGIQAERRRTALEAIAAGEMSAREIYEGSDAALTRRFDAELKKRGPEVEPPRKTLWNDVIPRARL
jgi:hypothetical protein